MLAEVLAACEVLGDAIGATDVLLLSGADCAQLVEALARSERRCSALAALAAARAAACGAHKDRGFSDPATWLADTCGSTTGAARAALKTAVALGDCPDTKEAVLSGELSMIQAGEITRTDEAVPGSEHQMLDAARAHPNVAWLKDKARKHRLEAEDPEQRRRRQHRARYWRHWVDEHGMTRVSAAFSVEHGVAIMNRVDTETDRRLRQAQHDKTATTVSEPRECVAADAAAAVIFGTARRGAGRAEVVLVCDLAAFQRGRAGDGEVCQVIGGGPVTVDSARELAALAVIKIVLHDGVRIDTVYHPGRYLSAELRTALGLGQPPLFDGVACIDCGRRYGIQWDHLDPYAHGGATCYTNLAARCWPCHHDKTERDRKAGLLNPKTPGTPTPGTVTPATVTPDTATPDTATPGTATPGTATPGTVTPGTATPGTATPGTATPGTVTATPGPSPTVIDGPAGPHPPEPSTSYLKAS